MKTFLRALLAFACLGFSVGSAMAIGGEERTPLVLGLCAASILCGCASLWIGPARATR